MSGARRLVPLAILLCALGKGTAHAQEKADPARGLYEEALAALADGRKHDASDQLARVIEQEPLHAGAWLDLALIQCGLGHAQEAERLFAEVETRFNPPAGMLELIAQARESGCAQWKAVSSTSLSVGRGRDNNVNQGAANRDLPLEPDFQPQRDDFSVVSLEHTREMTPNGSVGFAQLQMRRNDSLSQYDSASVFLGAEKPLRFGDWPVRASALFGMVSLGGKSYQRHAQLQARVTPPLPLPEPWQFGFSTSVTHVRYLTLTTFDATTAELRGQLTYRTGGLHASASLGYQYDYAHAARPGGNRAGWLGNVLVRKALLPRLTGEAAYNLQGWQGGEAYLPGFLNDVRTQATHVVRGSLIYGLSRNWALRLDARAVRNRENIAVFKYNNRLLQLSLNWQGP